jgi:FAD-dependent urate hydroxylase
MPASDGLLQWWCDLRWSPGHPVPARPAAMLRERFAGWAPPVRQVLAAVTDADTGFFPHFRHRVPWTWGHGRATVIGDAAHSMPPTRAQGANQALEDYNRFGASLSRLTPAPLASRYYVRWLGQVSSYLETRPTA